MALINIHVVFNTGIEALGWGQLFKGFEDEQPKEGWIPVERSLPEFATPILICSPSLPHSVVAVYEGRDLWRVVGGGIAGGVTHWQPLPEKAE
jgi:hypothetical protein